jgi:hypothetical protein
MIRLLQARYGVLGREDANHDGRPDDGDAAPEQVGFAW